MYLLVWSNACWPDQLPTEADIKNQTLSFGWLGLMPADLRGHILGEYEKKKLITSFRLDELSGPVLQNILGFENVKPWDLTKDKDKKEKKEALKDP